jgi:hypothetical protein
MKTRDEIIKECVGAVVACWNHYNDEPLGTIPRATLAVYLDKLLPEAHYAEWEAASDEYQRYIDSENIL